MRADRTGVGDVELCFVRHGETHWNLEGRVQGLRESALSAGGVLQSQAVARCLSRMGPWQAVYSSDLVRAQQTGLAVASALGLPLRSCSGLRERGQGHLEGALVADIQTPDIDSPDIRREDSESFAARCWQVIDIVSAPGGRAIVVTHGGVIRFLRQHLGSAHPNTVGVPRNGSISILTGKPPHSRWSVYDDVGHLRENDVLGTDSHDVLDALVGIGAGRINPSEGFT